MPVFALMTVTMTAGSWSEVHHCSVLNFPCRTEGDLINEVQPRPFSHLLLIKQNTPPSPVTLQLQIRHLHLADLGSPLPRGS